MRPAFELAGQNVSAGTRKTIHLTLPSPYAQGQWTIPVTVIHGKATGPTLFVCAAVHGDEIIGVEIIRRLLKIRSLNRLQGTLLAIPVVNVFGFINQERYLPDRRDLNRVFPGSSSGSLAARVADLFTTYILERCDFGIDLHTGSHYRANLPQIRATLSNSSIREMATSFSAPVIISAKSPEGSLRNEALKRNIPVIVYETGEALRFNTSGISTGLRGIVHVMRHIGMLQQSAKNPQIRTKPHVCNQTVWIRAPQGGTLIRSTPLGAVVGPGSHLGTIADPFSSSEYKITSQHEGIVIGKATSPLAIEGQALFHIALFDNPLAVSETIIELQEELEQASEQDQSLSDQFV